MNVKMFSLGELIFRQVEWWGNALKRLPWYSDVQNGV